jgi:DNA-binding HxlR family transcriptional regulator
LLIIRDLAAGPRRFVELQRVLPGISTEQLRSRLNRMVADGMLTRKRYREVPPRVDYEMTERARDLMPILGELARWGYEWAWGPPRDGEHIDIGAIFRLAAGLIPPVTGRHGAVELTVTDPSHGEGPAVYTLSSTDSGVTLEEVGAPEANAHISGSEEAWIRAFSPAADHRGLTVTGDQSLAGRVLVGLAPVAERARQVA